MRVRCPRPIPEFARASPSIPFPFRPVCVVGLDHSIRVNKGIIRTPGITSQPQFPGLLGADPSPVRCACAFACRNSRIAPRRFSRPSLSLSLSPISFFTVRSLHRCNGGDPCSFRLLTWFLVRGLLIWRFVYLPLCSDRCCFPAAVSAACRGQQAQAARLYPCRATIHGGEAVAAARRGEEAAGDGQQRRRRGVRPMDGVALQAAHYLGAPRRRVPSHVSKRPRILLLLLLLSLSPALAWGDGEACFVSPFATVFVRLRLTRRLGFLRVRKGFVCLCWAKYKSCQRDTTRCCNSVRDETQPCIVVFSFIFLFSFFLKNEKI